MIAEPWPSRSPSNCTGHTPHEVDSAQLAPMAEAAARALHKTSQVVPPVTSSSLPLKVCSETGFFPLCLGRELVLQLLMIQGLIKQCAWRLLRGSMKWGQEISI